MDRIVLLIQQMHIHNRWYQCMLQMQIKIVRVSIAVLNSSQYVKKATINDFKKLQMVLYNHIEYQLINSKD